MIALGLSEPRCISRSIREKGKNDKTQHHRRQSLHDEKPLPTIESEPFHIQQHRRHRCTERQTERHGHEQARQCPRAIILRKPVREIHDDAWKKSRLRHTEKEPCPVELRRRVHESHRCRDEAPSNQDAREPLPRTPSLHQQCAWNLQEQITDEEHANAEAEDVLRKPQCLAHAQLGKGHVRTIEVGDDVEQDDQRQHTPRDLAAKSDGIDGGRCDHGVVGGWRDGSKNYAFDSATTGLVSAPIFSMSMVTVSPGWRKTGGFMAAPTP